MKRWTAFKLGIVAGIVGAKALRVALVLYDEARAREELAAFVAGWARAVGTRAA